MSQEAAGLGLGFEDLHLVAEAGELPSGSEAGGPDPTMATRRPFGSATSMPGPSAVGVVPVGDEPLDPADRDRRLELAAGALALARRVAGAAERPDERRRVQDQLERLLVLAAADQRHVAVRLDPRRAGVDARRGALPG